LGDVMQKVMNVAELGAEEYAYLFDLIPCHISFVDRNLRIIKTNALSRIDFGDCVGEYCYKAFKKREDICPSCSVQETFADGRRHRCEGVIINRHGQSTEVMVHTAPVKNKQDEIVAVMELFTDISEMKALQKELELSWQEYKYLFEMVPCYISIQDRDFRIIESNTLFEQDFGDRLGEYCYSVYKGRDSVCPGCCVKKSFDDRLVHYCEETVTTRKGVESDVIVYTTPVFNEKGEIVAVMEMSTNITEVKKLQSELIMMGQSVAAMAHGIKNILTGLEGGMYVVGSGLTKQDKELIETGWEMVKNNVDKVSSLVKGLLYCSKERESEYEKIQPNQIARDVYELFREKTAREGLEFPLKLDESIGDAYLDPTGLHTVLSNLITNAIDACKFDFKESPHMMALKTQRGDDASVIFEVSDNGKGIPTAWKGRLFENSFSTKGGEGTGLGLLVTRKVVMEHNGEIIFDSKEGVRTTFKVRFPIKPKEKS
jgi:nitrogen-specific signal transduction histidine kinase